MSTSFAFAFGYSNDAVTCATTSSCATVASGARGYPNNDNDLTQQHRHHHDGNSDDDDFGDFVDVSRRTTSLEHATRVDRYGDSDNDDDFGDFQSADESCSLGFAQPPNHLKDKYSHAKSDALIQETVDLLGDDCAVAATTAAPAAAVASPQQSSTTAISDPFHLSGDAFSEPSSIRDGIHDNLMITTMMPNRTITTTKKNTGENAGMDLLENTVTASSTLAVFPKSDNDSISSEDDFFADFRAASTTNVNDGKNSGTLISKTNKLLLSSPAATARDTIDLLDAFTGASPVASAATPDADLEDFADFAMAAPTASISNDNFGIVASQWATANGSDNQKNKSTTKQQTKKKAVRVVEFQVTKPGSFCFYTPGEASNTSSTTVPPAATILEKSTAIADAVLDEQESRTTDSQQRQQSTPLSIAMAGPFDGLETFQASKVITVADGPTLITNDKSINNEPIHGNAAVKICAGMSQYTTYQGAIRNQISQEAPKSPADTSRNRDDKDDKNASAIVAALKQKHAYELEQCDAKMEAAIKQAKAETRAEMKSKVKQAQTEHDQAMAAATQQWETRLAQVSQHAKQILSSRQGDSQQQIEFLQKQLETERINHQQAIQALQRKFETNKFQTDGQAYKSMQKLEQKEKEWETERLEYESKANQLSTELSSLKESMAERQQLLESSLKTARDAETTWEKKFCTLQKESTAEKKKLQAQIDESRQTMQTLRARDSKFSNQVEKLERQLQASAESLAAACGNENAMEEALATQKSSYDEAYKKMETRLTEERSSLETELEVLRQSLAETEQANIQLSTELQVARENVSALCFRETKLHQSLQKSQQVATDWQNEILLRDKLIERLRADLLSRDGELASMEKHVEQLEKTANCHESVNLEYLKDVVVKYLSRPPGSSERSQLLPVLATLLKFDTNDYKIIEEGKQRLSWWGSVAPTLISSAASDISITTERPLP